jgi:hypothetical protein
MLERRSWFHPHPDVRPRSRSLRDRLLEGSKGGSEGREADVHHPPQQSGLGAWKHNNEVITIYARVYCVSPSYYLPARPFDGASKDFCITYQDFCITNHR